MNIFSIVIFACFISYFAFATAQAVKNPIEVDRLGK